MSDLPEPGSTTELVCIKGGWDAIRARVPPHGPKVVVRTGLSEVLPVEGEIFTVEVAKSWVFGHTRYVTGTITSTRLELDRLELPPLEATALGPMDPEEQNWDEDLLAEVAAELLRGGAREAFEIEYVLPRGAVKLRFEEDPILEAAELMAAGAGSEAADLLGELLSTDLRCLDAHAHLGNLEFPSEGHGALDRARRHYQIGVAIGDAALGGDFRGFLPWGLIDNRPFLRCLHGLGLCHWRAGDFDAALGVFRRLLLLNPVDNQGIRLLWPELKAGMSWEQASKRR